LNWHLLLKNLSKVHFYKMEGHYNGSHWDKIGEDFSMFGYIFIGFYSSIHAISSQFYASIANFHFFNSSSIVIRSLKYRGNYD
jgi:hypothetical protein